MAEINRSHRNIIRDKLNNVRTESSVLEEKQRGICKALGPLFYELGCASLMEPGEYDTDFGWILKDRNLDGGQSHWEWRMRKQRDRDWTSGVKVVFKRPFYKNTTINSHDPVKKGREPETAFSFVVENKSDAALNKDVTRTIQIDTGKITSKENNLHFDVSVSATGGTSGQEANGGTTALFTASASFGGSFTWGEENHEFKSDTREISDEIILKPMSYYEVEAYYDKLNIERTIDISGICDFEIEITVPGWKEHWIGEDDPLKINAKSVEDLILELSGKGKWQAPWKNYWTRNPNRWVGSFGDLCGYREDIFRGVDWLLTPDNRKVTVSQTFEYNGASDVSLRVIKKHDYVYENGEYKFGPPSVKESDIKTINVV